MLFFLIALIGFIFKNQIRRTLAFAVGWQRKRFFFFFGVAQHFVPDMENVYSIHCFFLS